MTMARPAPLRQPLRGGRFEMKPKKVVLLSQPLPDHTAGKVAALSPYKEDLVAFIRRIESGLQLPDSFYRTGVDDTPDELLAITGVKHVHLGLRGSNVLLYCIEYDTFVMLLEVNDHKHFGRVPVGALLRSTLDAPTLHSAIQLHGPAADRAERIRLRKLMLAKIGGRSGPPAKGS
jgi:hypothetical protein